MSFWYWVLGSVLKLIFSKRKRKYNYHFSEIKKSPSIAIKSCRSCWSTLVTERSHYNGCDTILFLLTWTFDFREVINVFCTLILVKIRFKFGNYTRLYLAITYASPIWGTAAVTHIKKMHQVSQNKIIRSTVIAPWLIQYEQIDNDTNTTYLFDHIHKLSLK